MKSIDTTRKRKTEVDQAEHSARLEPNERELELARMLSGSASDAALANAKELLSEAQTVVGST